MKKSMRFCIIATTLLLLISCDQHKAVGEGNIYELAFPYQAYLDSVGEGESFPTIGNDGNGFNAISHNIVYPELPSNLSASLYADSLLQFYNIALAFNTMAYDVGTAERYLDEQADFGLKEANALESINLSGIHLPKIKEFMRIICRKNAAIIRKGEKPNERKISEIGQFYDVFNDFSDQLYDAHLDDGEFDPAKIISDYREIHSKALTDTTSFRNELLDRVLAETDFQKQCVLARELAYANYHSNSTPYAYYLCTQRDDKQIVTVLDKLLKSGKYSPLLGELWRMWRCMLQLNILGGRSNDSAMYNLFYNEMRNRIALVYIAHMVENPEDKLAFKEFARLATTYNIVRNGPGAFGNNGNLEDMELFYSVFQSEKDEDK